MQRALMTTVFDAAGEGSAKACWVLMRRARADRFESASAAAIPATFQRVAFRRPEKPDMDWSALRAAERAVISVVEIGYVRRSEFTPMFHCCSTCETASGSSSTAAKSNRGRRLSGGYCQS